MGGSALGIETRRLSREEYERFSRHVHGELVDLLPKARMAIVKAYAEKPDFGDLDLVAALEDLPEDFAWQIDGHFTPRATRPQLSAGSPPNFARQGFSFEVDGFQVDLILVPGANYDFACRYFAFNDLGNLIGRVAHKFGLKFGWQGLEMPLRDGDHQFGRLTVTRDWEAALRFLGYDPARWEHGFERLEDVFAFAASTPYFHPDIYLLENRNHKARTRDAKRPSYRAFLRWLEAHREALPAYRFTPEKAFYLPRIFAAFPDFESAYREAWRRHETERALKRRFNGDLVRAWTGLDGRELSRFLGAFVERQGGPEAWRAELPRLTDEAIRERVTRFARGWSPGESPAP